ncbi:MAG TPA: S53 family peptidase, partial [Ktedonobacterales bacterium]|nr:S53 family peptidase [Ktedonobacterales bacterium]
RPHLQRIATAPRSGPNGGFDPTELRGAYDVASLIGAGGTGSGQRLAVFELAPFIPNDFFTYENQFGLPGTPVNQHSIDGAPVTCATPGSSCDIYGTSEADLDVEIVTALAPNVTQDVYTGPNTRVGVLKTYQAIATDNVDKVVTTSWGLCEAVAGDSFMRGLDQIFAQNAAQGQTVYAAAGDNGSDDCQTGSFSSAQSVRSPASDPYVVGVGGTSLSIAGGPSYGSEVAWNDTVSRGVPFATGGGVSTFFSRPGYQVGVNIPSAQPQLRLVPDVSANADPFTGYAIYCTSAPLTECGGFGWFGEFGGTSAAAPLWAAITTDINTYLVANAKPTVGWINTALYQLLGNAQTNAPFHDVTSGNNQVDSVPGFSAGACYDQVTGAGSPDAWNIARDFQGGVATGGGGSCPTPAPPATTNLIQNGGFENGTNAPWQEFSQTGAEEIISGFPSLTHNGTAAFYPCLYPSCDDRVSQTVTVPASVSSATMVYWVDSISWLDFSTPALACLDHFYVTLATPDGTVFDTVQSACATNTFGYTVQAVDVTAALQAHLNQQIVVMIRATTSGVAGDEPLPTGWEVDDVSLIVS